MTARTAVLACKLCVATRGLKGSDLDGLPETEEELYAHLEAEHHIPVRRAHETTEQCRERFQIAHPEALDEKTCKCPTCAFNRAGQAEEDAKGNA